MARRGQVVHQDIVGVLLRIHAANAEPGVQQQDDNRTVTPISRNATTMRSNFHPTEDGTT